MAIVYNGITAGSAGTATTHNTASVTPTANALQLFLIATQDNSSSVTTLDGSGNGLTWVLVPNTIGGGNCSVAGWSETKVVMLFQAMTASPSTGVTQINHTLTTASQWAWIEFQGVDTSGTNGSGAIVQSHDGFAFGASSVTVTLNAFGNVNNATFGAFQIKDFGLAGLTAGAGFTLGQGSNQGAGAPSVTTEYKLSNDTTVDISCTTTSNLGGFAVEIKAAGGAFDPSTNPIWMPQTPMQNPSVPRMIASGTVSTTRLP